MRYLLALLLLSGCANYATLQADAISRGDLVTAERLTTQDIRAGRDVDKSWHNLGVVYERKGQRAQAINAYTMAARYGNPGSQQALIALGAKVPAADLAQPSGSDAAANAIDGFNRGYSGGINCTTLNAGSLAHTNCR